MKRYDGYVESVASSHFCLFGAGSSEGSVDKHNLIRIESWTTLLSITLENSLWPIWWYIKTFTHSTYSNSDGVNTWSQDCNKIIFFI